MMGRASTTSPILNITSATSSAVSEAASQPPTRGMPVIRRLPTSIRLLQLDTSREVHTAAGSQGRPHQVPQHARPARLRAAEK
jgi:hypothetical protein